ncbi:MAG: flagellar FlbD family protein [bacterium]
MITLHKLNGAEFIINAELIESMESTPDTVINLVTGNRFIVKDPLGEVVEKIIVYRKKINSEKKVVNPIEGFKRE